MTQSEKEEKAREMQTCALALNKEKRDRSGYKATVEDGPEAEPKQAKFFK